MKYYSEAEVLRFMGLTDRLKFSRVDHDDMIEVQKCGECPFFEEDYWQPDPQRYLEGWCRRMSRDFTDEEDYPHYVYVRSIDFCNKRAIVDYGDEYDDI